MMPVSIDGARIGTRPQAGVYIHIPYCRKKCVYCSFNSRETASGVPAAYVDALVEDLETSAPEWEGARFGSVYLGGGTPSLLEPAQLDLILSAAGKSLGLSGEAEITLECNPSSLSYGRLLRYRDLGVNRLSVGVQSLSAGELGLLGRLHSPGEAVESLESARAAGFSNISCDIMVGVPGQTAASLGATLRAILPLAHHISCYLLSVEPGTPLEGLVERGGVRPADEDEVIALFEGLEVSLDRAGFARYEISNWSRPGFECRHNLVYWSRGDYLGLGAGASSHRRHRRSRRIEHPDSYIEAVRKGDGALCFEEVVTPEGVLLEEVMLRLRTMQGLDLGSLAGRRGRQSRAVDCLVANLHREGLVIRNCKGIQLSPKGMLVSDSIIGDLSAALITP
jgi:oxygen-independent coproporphyrinogen-3 oxidase